MTGPETHIHTDTHIARLAGRQKKFGNIFITAPRVKNKEESVRNVTGRRLTAIFHQPTERKEAIVFLENVAGQHKRRRRVANEDVFVLTCLRARHSSITREKNLNTNSLIW